MTDRTELEMRSGLARHLARLWRYALVLSGKREAAEHLVQATCLRAIERSDRFPAGARLDRWLFSLLRSIWMDKIHACRIRRGEVSMETEITPNFAGENPIEANIKTYQTLRDVGSLPQEYREALFLVYVEGLTYRETAELLDVPIGTVMSRLAAARLRLGAQVPPGRPTSVP
jgi:RNA polymerase sigma-70 factor (ECF subfamily)